MRFFNRALSGLFLVALTIGLLAAAGGVLRGALQDRASRDAPARQAREQVFAAPVTTLIPEDIAPVLTTFGEIDSRRVLQVRATTGGRIVALGNGVEEGGAVEAGQLLFEIDPREADRALAVSRADLSDAEVALADAERGAELAAEDVANARNQQDLQRRAFDRQRELQDRGIGSAQAVETAELSLAAADQSLLSRRQMQADAEAAVSQARTALDRSRIALSEAERGLEDTRVTAPFDGVLADVTAVEGAVITANEQMAELIDPDALEVAFRVSAGEYARLLDDTGDLAAKEVTVRLDAGSFSVMSPATVTREAAQVAEGQTGRQIFARLELPEGFLAGDFVVAELREPVLEGVARLPDSAVGTDGGILVLGEDERLTRAEVEVLRRQGDGVLVRVGDLEGREVLTERSPSLGVGIKVRPLREDDDGTASEPVAEYLELSDERRARLVAFVEGNDRMPDAAKERVLAQLRADRVPANVVASLEGRMGG